MPAWSEDELRAAIDQGRIAGVALDTSIFYKYGLRLSSKGLQSFRQFSGSQTRFVLPDTVAFEVKKAVASTIATELQNHKMSFNKLSQFIELSGNILPESSEVSAISNKIFEKYVTDSGALVLSAHTYCSIEKVQAAYFQLHPPFENKSNKKEEFPDAIALSTLEGWAKHNGKVVLVGSNDTGWISFCDTSEWLVSIRNIGSILDLFNRSNSFISERIKVIFQNPLAGELEGDVELAVERYAERASLVVDANAPFHFETEDYGAAATGHRVILPVEIKILEANDDFVTVSIPILIDMKTEVDISYYAKDDGEYLSIGSDWVQHDFSAKAELVLSAQRPENGEISFTDCEVDGPSVLRVDLGILHPFREE